MNFDFLKAGFVGLGSSAKVSKDDAMRFTQSGFVGFGSSNKTIQGFVKMLLVAVLLIVGYKFFGKTIIRKVKEWTK